MLAVQPEVLHTDSIQNCQIQPSMTQNDIQPAKPQQNKKLLTPLNILIIVSILVIIGAGSYYLINFNSEKDIKNSIKDSHNKIITNAGSSKQQGSNSGSSNSKGSSTNSKSTSKSLPASKGVISSNPNLIGSNGKDPNEEDNNNGDKNDKTLKKGSTTDASSNPDDSDSEDEQNENEVEEIIVYWDRSSGENNQNNNSPIIGSKAP